MKNKVPTQIYSFNFLVIM